MIVRIWLIIVVCLCVTKQISAQDTLTSANVEQKTYQLYLDKNWSELIKYGNAAIKKGYDYYYLQLRIGIAYYEKKNYALAENYFLNALKFNSDDELILEYIYYCYLFNGRYDDARLWSKKFNLNLSQKIGTDKLSAISFVMFEAGTKITDKKNYYSDITKTNSNFYNPPVYIQFGLNHYIKNKVALFHALTYFNQQTFVNKVSQFQYFLKASIPLKHSWSISPSFHYINLGVSSDYTVTRTDTLWPPGVPPHTQPPPGAPPFKTVTTSTTTTSTNQSNYFIGSLSAQKIVKKFVFGLGATVLNMSNVTQYINSGFVSYAPFGNNKFVLGLTGYAHTIDSYKTTYVATAPFVYIQPVQRVSLKLSYYNNSKFNIVEDNGYLVNNSGDLTKSRYSALLNFSVNSNVSLYGLYQLENKYESQQQFNYQYNVLVAGIKIIPYKK